MPEPTGAQCPVIIMGGLGPQPLFHGQAGSAWLRGVKAWMIFSEGKRLTKCARRGREHAGFSYCSCISVCRILQ
ncbi:MAG: hypothetical protein ACPL4E_09555, partial [Thermoproteota archaeon]